MTTFHAIYQERAYLRRGGHHLISEIFRECARLYNAAIQRWQTAYQYERSIADCIPR